MSTIQNIGVSPPVAPLPEPRIAQGQDPATTREDAPRSSTADQIRTEALAARDANRARAEEAKDTVEIKGTAKYESQVGLIEGTFAPFVDIVDPRYQQRIARVFGPADAPPAIAEAPVPTAVRKAYESVSGATAGTFRQSA